MTDKSNSRWGRFQDLASLGLGFASQKASQTLKSAFQNEEEKLEAQKRFWSQQALTITQKLGEMKGAAMKLGQMMSLETDILPKEVTNALSKLQADAPAMDYQDVKTVVEESMGLPIKKIFSSFSKQAIGAASIGQVHLATTLSGQQVAVKVQYPDIREHLESDLKNLRSLLSIAGLMLSKEKIEAYLDEVSQTFLLESDYLLEAESLDTFNKALQKYKGVTCPKAHLDLCTDNILVMDYMPGEHLVTWLNRCDDQERRQKVIYKLVETYLELFHGDLLLHGDTHPGNFLIDAQDQIIFLDMGCVKTINPKQNQAILKIIKATLLYDKAGLLKSLTEAGYEFSKVKEEAIFATFSLFLEPVLTPGVFNFSKMNISHLKNQLFRKHPSLLYFYPPEELLFFFKGLAGLFGICSQNNISLDVNTMANTLINKHLES